MRDLLVRAEWFKGFENAPEEVKKEIFYRIIKEGCFEEKVNDSPNDHWGISSVWNGIQGNIQRMKDAQERKIEYGRTHGRKPMANEEKVYEYLQQHPSAKVKEIGMELGLEKGNSSKGAYAYIYDMGVWKNRKKINADVSFEEYLSAENSVNGIPITEKNSEIGIGITENFSEKEIPISEKIPKIENGISEKFEWVF